MMESLKVVSDASERTDFLVVWNQAGKKKKLSSSMSLCGFPAEGMA